MGFKKLGRYIRNNEFQTPEYLQQYMGEFSPTEYSGAVLDEIQRRSGESGGRQMGQLASYYGGAGRSMGGMMGKSLSDAAAENMQRERGDMAGYMDQAYQQHQNRGVQAGGIQASMQNAYTDALARGYTADQAKAAAIRVAQTNLEGTKYGWDTRAGIAGADRGLQERFGLMDRDYRNEMMPFDQFGRIAGPMGGLLGNFGTNNQYGTQSTQGPGMNTGLSMLQGGFGGGLMGAGMGGGKGGGGGSAQPPMYQGGWGMM